MDLNCTSEVWAFNTSIDFISRLCPLSCSLHVYKSTVEDDSCSVSDIAFIVVHLCFKNHILATTPWKKKGGSVLCLCACGEGGLLVYSNLISLQIFTKLHMNIISLILCFCNQQGLVHLAEGLEQMYGNIQGEIFNFVGVIFMPCEKHGWSCIDVLQLLLWW